MNYLNREAVDWAFDLVVEISNDKLVLLAIARRANKHWAAFPGKAEIARVTGLAEVSVARCIKRLEDDGHLVRVAFAATNRQDQKAGFVLAGCGRKLDALDADFLALAFADRKQAGVPLAAKPQHWSGERTGEGRTGATLPGSLQCDPQGRSAATPRRKNNKEDQKEQEDGAVARADDGSSATQNPGAIARVAPPAPTRTREILAEPEIPTQRTPRKPNLRQQRDDDWHAQLEAAPLDLLESAIESYRDSRDDLYEWARGEASGELGLNPAVEHEPDVEARLLRRLYLFLLKRHAADGDPAGDELAWPLDETIRAAPRPYMWEEYCPVPDGQSAQEFSDAMRLAVSRMTVAERGQQIAEIRRSKPGIWKQCREKAKAYMRECGMRVESVSMNNYAMQLAIKHYLQKEEWPIAMVPRSMRPVPAVSDPPPWAA